MTHIILTRFTEDDHEQFILDNQRAFRYGAAKEAAEIEHLENGKIIFRRRIEDSISTGTACCIRENGGIVLQIDEKTQHNHLDLLFVDPEVHSKGIRYSAWLEIGRLYPETRVW